METKIKGLEKALNSKRRGCGLLTGIAVGLTLPVMVAASFIHDYYNPKRNADSSYAFDVSKDYKKKIKTHKYKESIETLADKHDVEPWMIHGLIAGAETEYAKKLSEKERHGFIPVSPGKIVTQVSPGLIFNFTAEDLKDDEKCLEAAVVSFKKCCSFASVAPRGGAVIRDRPIEEAFAYFWAFDNAQVDYARDLFRYGSSDKIFERREKYFRHLAGIRISDEKSSFNPQGALWNWQNIWLLKRVLSKTSYF